MSSKIKLSHSDRDRTERKVEAMIAAQCQLWDASTALEKELDYEGDGLKNAVEHFCVGVDDIKKITPQQIRDFTNQLLEEFT